MNPEKKALIASLIQSTPEKIEATKIAIDQEMGDLVNVLNSLGERMKAVGNAPEAVAPLKEELVQTQEKMQQLELKQQTIKEYLSSIAHLEKEIIIKSINRKLKKKDFLQEGLDNASDREIKYSLTTKIEQLDQEIKEMMEQLDI